MLSQEDLSRLKEIALHVKDANEDFFHLNCIDYGRKGDYWILNYQQGGGRNEYNRLCRGLVVHQPTGLIHSFPFARFFNFGEKDAVPLDFSNAEIMEKMDGTMVGVSFPSRNPEEPLWQTRKMLSTHDNNFEMKSFYGENFKLMTLIGEYVKKLVFNKAYTHCTWVFEFIHKHTQVITKYNPDQYGLYLIGCRDLDTYHEFSEKELDGLAVSIGAKRPRRWDAVASHDLIVQMFSDHPKDFEGFVVRERETANRNKVKSDDYVKVHHLLTKISYKNLLPLWIAGEQDEVVTYFPQAQEKIDKIAAAFEKFADTAVEKILFWHNKKLTRKELAMLLTGQVGNEKEDNQVLRGLIFQHDTEARKGPVDVKELVVQNLKKASVYKLKELLALNDDDDASVVLIEE
jgi:hypothetical protein